MVKIHWNTLLKILYLKGYKWLLSQKQLVRIDFLCYKRSKALAMHIKPFLKQDFSERMSVTGLLLIKVFISFLFKKSYLHLSYHRLKTYCIA